VHPVFVFYRELDWSRSNAVTEIGTHSISRIVCGARHSLPGAEAERPNAEEGLSDRHLQLLLAGSISELDRGGKGSSKMV
ncbi:MAG: hypothetical protein ABF308_24555, partial [Phaeobacter gallaeciensis]